MKFILAALLAFVIAIPVDKKTSPTTQPTLCSADGTSIKRINAIICDCDSALPGHSTTTKGVKAMQTTPARKVNATTTRPYSTTTRLVDPTGRPEAFTLSQSTAHGSSIAPTVHERLLCPNGSQGYQSVVNESQRTSDSPSCQVMFRCSPRPPINLELEPPTMSEVCAEDCQKCLSESGKCCSQCLAGTPYCVCKTVHYAIIGSVVCVAAPICVTGYLAYCVIAAGTAAVQFCCSCVRS